MVFKGSNRVCSDFDSSNKGAALAYPLKTSTLDELRLFFANSLEDLCHKLLKVFISNDSALLEVATA